MTHGGNIFEIERKEKLDRKTLLDYSANINPLGLPKSLKRIIQDRMEDLQYYPDIYYEDLKAAISQYYSLIKEDIFVGNGAAQVIFDTIHRIKPQKSIILAPTFSEYEKALKSCESTIVEVPLQEEDNFDLNIDALIEKIDDTIDLVVLCNPNNPTSRLIEMQKIEKILLKCQQHQVYLMIDEAFMDFVEDQPLYSMLPYYKKHKNIVIVRAFTKFYGVPGLRLGFGVCSDKTMIEEINKNTLPWCLNTFAGYFGEVLLAEDNYVEATHQWLRKEKRRFFKALQNIEGIKAFPPSVNFILIKILKTDSNAHHLKEKLLQQKILIRDCSNFTNLDDKFFRVAIKIPEQNNVFLKALKKILNEISD
ncbi:L-threonine O-3-phosphate decarboxylase [Natronincola peptidivorans]|uniref:threonine-phosphate decarboxylase n=1 Tax=Natronincola peptidivorans TaxID=426128 RepID=A0A1I0DJ49_9FIRM|nr:threonine-phosphate decarboxylase CobD [Natronincola peptidivorans]SET32472.1 L-threonine O-3-phosphate decarboxylase [Natronincola peptidivorans]